MPVKFDYGAHGEKEIKNIFCLIGIEDVFANIESKMASKDRIDIRGKINSMTHIRNNIIHEDATPSLTHIEIKAFLETIKTFAMNATELLSEQIDNILANKL